MNSIDESIYPQTGKYLKTTPERSDQLGPPHSSSVGTVAASILEQTSSTNQTTYFLSRIAGHKEDAKNMYKEFGTSVDQKAKSQSDLA
jgi:hypothetical protein